METNRDNRGPGIVRQTDIEPYTGLRYLSKLFRFMAIILLLLLVAAGVGGGLYGINDNTLRQQMAVFLLKALEGSTYVPPDCTNPTFGDVPCSSPFATWIYDLVARGITAGCGGGNYCPVAPVLRQQMAVFLVKTFNLPL